MSISDNSAPESRFADLIARRRPGWSLEQSFYTDPDLFAWEIQKIYRHHWLFVGHANRIPHPGDYFTFTFAGDPLLLIRAEDGQVHAFFNVCRHRGSRLCLEEAGHVNNIICPYHQWVYARDGALLSAKYMPEDFDRAQFPLHRAACRVVEGLIFLCFAPEPPDFTIPEQAIRAHLALYELEQARIACTRRYQVQANWKVMEENFRECYHCPVGHPEYCHTVLGSTFTEPREPIRAIHQEREAAWKQQGLETLSIHFSPENPFHCARYPLRPGFVSESLDGQPVAPLLGRLPERDAGILAIVMFPNFWFEASGDYACSMRRMPISPTLSEVEATWLVHADAVEGRDYTVEQVTAFWRITGEQDWKLCEDTQSGVNSSCYQPGPYAAVEGGTETFVRWYLNQLAA